MTGSTALEWEDKDGDIIKSWRSLVKAICAGYEWKIPLKHITFMWAREQKKSVGGSEESNWNPFSMLQLGMVLLSKSTEHCCRAGAEGPLGRSHERSL